MIQAGGSLGFLEETSPAIRIRGQARRQYFDCHHAVQASVLGFVDFAHSTGAEFLKQLILEDCLADHKFCKTRPL